MRRCLREEFGTPCVVRNPPRWRFPRWEYSGLEILLGEGGDVELGARTSEHITVFAFDPLVSKLSLFTFVHCIIHIAISFILVLCLASFILLYHLLLVLPCIISYCYSSLYAWLDCVCLTCT